MRASKLTLSLFVLLLVLATSAQAFPVSAHTGCVRTPGYWKNHLEAWPAWISPNFVVPKVGMTYIDILNYGGPNMDVKLAKFWIAAQLTFQIATAPQYVVDVFTAAQAYLFFGAPADPNTVEYWKNVLDAYLNGIGDDVPPPCE